TPAHLRLRSWSHDYQRLLPAARHLTAEAGAALEGLVARCRERPPAPELLAERRRLLGGRVEERRGEWRAEAERAAAKGSVPPARLAAELWPLLRDEPWTLVQGSLNGWERRLWEFDGEARHLGWHGGGGLGYGPGAAIGAALALAPER